MSRRCESCGELGWDADGRYCIACGGRLVEVVEVVEPDPPPPPPPAPEPRPEPPPPAPVPERRPPAAVASDDDQRIPLRPVRETSDEVPMAAVLAGIVVLLLVLLVLLLLT